MYYVPYEEEGPTNQPTDIDTTHPTPGLPLMYTQCMIIIIVPTTTIHGHATSDV